LQFSIDQSQGGTAVNFEDRPEDAAFRQEAREFLEQHAKRKEDVAGKNPMAHEAGSDEEGEFVRAAQAWQATLFDNGWAGITWPKEVGGRGGNVVDQLIFNQELSKFDVPSGVFAQGIGMAGPTLLVHGTEEQKAQHLKPMLRGDILWCQLFSEPNAGSDLAALRTRADRDGDEYVINGQKVWTSSAHYADWGILLARTDFDQPKHRGITYFLLDMKTPGIDIRPLRQITGEAHFNEVFLDDVRIPVANVVGPVNAGWGVTMTTLTNERTLIGGGGHDSIGPLLRLLKRFGGNDDPRIRQRVAEAYSEHEMLRFLGYRVQSALLRGEQPGPESSILKLLHTRHITKVADLGMEIAGASAMINDTRDPDIAELVQSFLGQFSSKIGGGTDEVQRNIVAERVLGMPGDSRTDKGVPFRDLIA
jgi:alkylation response protein AidB-like acyl-CoA dehydrogenase